MKRYITKSSLPTRGRIILLAVFREIKRERESERERREGKRERERKKGKEREGTETKKVRDEGD